MKSRRSSISILLVLVIMVTSFSACGTKKAPTPQQKEAQRQKLIKNAERERREG